MSEGKGPAPALMLLLIERLPDDSMTAALAAGGREYLGWGTDRHLRADLFDALMENTRATGNWPKNGVPKPIHWPRPKTKAVAQKNKDVTVKQLYAQYQSGGV